MLIDPGNADSPHLICQIQVEAYPPVARARPISVETSLRFTNDRANAS